MSASKGPVGSSYGGPAASLPIAEAKIAPPRRPSGVVSRARLRAALDADPGAALTLVSAPPGYGKTLAVRDWCEHRDVTFAWVTLDPGDNDPARFWTYVATAVDRVREGLGRTAVQRLVYGAPVEESVDELANGIAAYASPLVVVLDDLHVVTDQSCLSTIDRFLEGLPASARMVGITRVDPFLRLPRLRARAALAEVRADALAFTAGEARELLTERMGLSLGLDEVSVLHERTEGWPAAIYLAGLWLRTIDDPGPAIRAFGASERFIGDYLSQEVFGSLDDDERHLLIVVSVLGRFTAELCDAVSSRSDSAVVLARLEQSNLFVSRLSTGGWYRVHSLFAEFARLHLAREATSAEREIHERAAAWLRARGLLAEAADHAASAGDEAQVAEILERGYLRLIRTGEARPLLRSAASLPDHALVSRPELAAAAATAAAIVGGPNDECRRYLGLLARARDTHPDGLSANVEAIGAMVRSVVDRDVGRALAEGRKAVRLAEAGADDVLVAALAAAAQASYFAGHFDEASSLAGRAVEHHDVTRRPPGHAFARATLALVAAEQDRPSLARRHAVKAKSLLSEIGATRTWLGAVASTSLGSALACAGRLPEAERELVQAERLLLGDAATVYHAWLLLLLARVRCRRGRLDQADEALGAAREELAELVDAGLLESLTRSVAAELEQARAWAGSGELLERLTEAESAVLRLLGSDRSAREIGGVLFLSANTVRSHIRAIYRKLDVHSREDAVARAETLGLLERSRSPR